MRVCVRKTCGSNGLKYHGRCRENVRDTCGSYLPSGTMGATRPRPPRPNMTATEVLQRRKDWSDNHMADALGYTTAQADKIINPPIIEKQEINKMDQFESALNKAKTGKLVAKVDTAKESLIETAKRTKNTVVRIKVGRLAITAIKSALKKTPGIPVYAKMLLDSEYADIVIGAVTPIIVPMITDSARAKRLSEDINIAGGVAIADKLTFIDDFVAQIIEQVSSAVGPEDLVEETPTAKEL